VQRKFSYSKYWYERMRLALRDAEPYWYWRMRFAKNNFDRDQEEVTDDGSQ
jgi:hypothetical protein